MLPVQGEFEDLLQRLREEQTESPTVDGKEDLTLESVGDRADFIRHVAALANNVERSYLIIGVENRTWNEIGLAEHSTLRNSDETQQGMNQVLQNRLDPNLSVRYRTYEIDGVMYGLVAIEGTRAPYIISIEEQRYGGDRPRGAPSYIYRGVIYTRRGANSVIANRQSEILGIVTKAGQMQIDSAQPDEFLAACNYLDVESEDFGHHRLTADLIEKHRKTDQRVEEYSPAWSWVSFIFYPVDSECTIDTIALEQRLVPDQRIGRGAGWYRGIPWSLSEMFYKPCSVTSREYLGKWNPLSRNAEIMQFIRIRPSGHIELVCTYPLFIQHDDKRCFFFVTLVGYFWQMLYLSRAIYQSFDFHGEIGLLINLIGTKETRLADFADGWLSPMKDRYFDSPRDICQYQNIQVERRLALFHSTDDEIKVLVRGVAQELGSYYGQEDQPRCFNTKTDDFPSRRYARNVRS